MNYACPVLALAVLASTSAFAADITFTPPAAGGFTVTKPASADTRFRIGETGTSQLFIDSNSGLTLKSANGFAVLDLDAIDGNSGLRYFKNGVANWNVRNRPTDDYLEWFEAPGGARMVIQKGTGNVGIGETTSPVYKLDVLHGGSTGIRSRSSGSFSVVDIDAASGDAALRFARAGTNQWNVRNNPGTDDLQFFELGGGGERMRITNTTGAVVVAGNFTAGGVKAFTIDHPMDPENRTLSHAAIESNEVLNAYSGNVTTDAQGRATVLLPEYFETINRDYRYQLTAVGVFAQAIVAREIAGNSFEIATSLPNVKVSWEVKGVRSDVRMKMDPFAAVKEKPEAMRGRYLDAKAWGQTTAKSAVHDPAVEPGEAASSVSDRR